MSESVGLTHSRRLRRTSASSLGTVPVRRRNVQFLSRKIKNACSNFLPACAGWVNRREQHRYDSEVNLPLRVCCAQQTAREARRIRRRELVTCAHCANRLTWWDLFSARIFCTNSEWMETSAAGYSRKSAARSNDTKMAAVRNVERQLRGVEKARFSRVLR